VRKTGFADSMNHMALEAGSIIYSLGDKVTNVFFVREGIVQLEIFFEVQHYSSAPSTPHPINGNIYDRLTTT
jgi:hypothetical protein